jgi:peptidoglycan-associated lipoprotein
MFAACSKKVAKITPLVTPPPPATPAAAIAAYPNVIQMGQSTTLSWQSQNADDLTIEGLGTVTASGSRAVIPTASTTYTLIAKGPGGTQDATARVTVNPVVARTAASPPDESDVFARKVKDVFFAYNKADIRSEEKPVADNDAQFLAQHPEIKVQIEGHCDDRGSEEYNLALGDSRAMSLKAALEKQGVSAERISTMSYGKEKPFCNEEDEQCWQQNRRDHLILQR